MKRAAFSLLLWLQSAFVAASALANPYLRKLGENPIPIRLAASAITGGFIHNSFVINLGKSSFFEGDLGQ